MSPHQFLGHSVYSVWVSKMERTGWGEGDTHPFCLVLSLTILVKRVSSVFSSLRGWWWEWEVGLRNSKESLSEFWKYKMPYNMLCSWRKGRNLEKSTSWRPLPLFGQFERGVFPANPWDTWETVCVCASPFPSSVTIRMLSCFFSKSVPLPT